MTALVLWAVGATLLAAGLGIGWWNERVDRNALEYKFDGLKLEIAFLEMELDDEPRRKKRLHVIRGAGEFTDEDDRDTEPPEAG